LRYWLLDGTIGINVTTPTGTMPVDLINVALSTGFLTNLVSLHALKKVDIHFDSENSRLHRKGKTFALLAEVVRSWVVEHNPMPVSKRRQAPTAKVLENQLPAPTKRPKAKAYRTRTPPPIEAEDEAEDRIL
jgi:hypothetical protein